MGFNKFIRSFKKQKFDGRRNHVDSTCPNGVILFSGIGYEIDLEKCINISEYIDKIDLSTNAQSSIFCDIIKQQCIGSVYIDRSNTMVLTNKSFIGVLDSINESLNSLDLVDSIAHDKLIEDTLSFFDEKKVVVIQEGIQGSIYKAGRFIQSYGSTALTIESIMMSRLMGVTGSKVFAGQPLLYVALPTVGGIFFHGMSIIVGENVVGRSCQSLGNVLLIPMKGTEVVLNNLVFLPLGRITGIPILINMTEAINVGSGLSIKDAKSLVNVVRNGKLSPLWKKLSRTFEIWFR